MNDMLVQAKVAKLKSFGIRDGNGKVEIPHTLYKGYRLTKGYKSYLELLSLNPSDNTIKLPLVKEDGGKPVEEYVKLPIKDLQLWIRRHILDNHIASEVAHYITIDVKKAKSIEELDKIQLKDYWDRLFKENYQSFIE